MPNWYLGRTGQLYAAEESAYGTAPTLQATNAYRHLKQKLAFNPRNLAKSPARYTHPSLIANRVRRQTADFMVGGEWIPSGTLNTLAESDVFLKNGLGATKNTTLATTFSGSPTTTGGTIASATGLAVGDAVLINIAAGPNVGTYLRWLTTAGTSPVWTPALPAAPLSGDTLKGVVNYSLATALPKSLDVAHYPQAPAASTPARELLGCVVDKLSFQFDGNIEPMVEFSGPAQGFAGTSPSFTPQAQPGGFTTVGGESGIPSGLTGYFYYNGTLYQIEKLQIDVVNAMDVQNTALGTAKPVAYFRKGERSVTVKIDAKVSDDTTLWTPSLGSTVNPLMIQIGTSQGKIFGIYCPNVQFTDNPDIPDSDETNNWTFQGTALGSAGNDELYIAAA